VLAATLVAAATLTGCDRASSPSKSAFKSLDITGASYGRELSLTDPDGQRRTLGQLQGKLAVVFFGYTQCPDVCPTTLTNLAEAQRLMGPDGDKLVGVFVSVDPERDKPALLKDYVGSFSPQWLGLTGTPDEVAAAAKEFKVFYRKVPGKTETSYTVDHTAASYVYDTRGRLRLYVRHATPPADMAADFKRLLADGS
jgi:protein SCO1/2